jgi:carbonic anhydrase/acetyltransferase-like protein (isoleucine patch superfamily)
MSTATAAKLFIGILPSLRQDVVTVELVNADGTSVVSTDAGSQFLVLGDSVTVGNMALIEGNRIIGPADDLMTENATV